MDVRRFLERSFPDHFIEKKLREDVESAMFRGRRTGDGKVILYVTSASGHPTSEWLARLEREHDLRNDLELPWAARPLALVRREGRVVLLLEDPGGMPLDAFPNRRRPIAESLRLAIGVAVCLSRVHAKWLLHKDIKPANILADTATGATALTGFGLAAASRHEREAGGHPKTLSGTLAYMAPEQTGRMNRSIDGRADLYALGVVLYEALTGTLPFTATDPLELVHSHLARMPVPPSERNPSIPALLSDLILKLLAKTPEDRYQTARGVEADLLRCLAAWEARGRLDPFLLAEGDAPDRLLSPVKLYGREREVGQLLVAWERAAEGKGPELALVSGYAGVGKSALVHELRHAVQASGGNFAAGKFDQYRRGRPYATLADAVGGLIRSLLAKPEEELARWRKALSEALGSDGKVLAEIVPELEFLLGPLPSAPDLSPREAHERFLAVFTRLLDALAPREHPLALFLDDLQWLDPETLGLLNPLLTHTGMRHLLLVGAYRDNEVPDTHPLALSVQALRKAGVAVRGIVLSPLAPEDMAALNADMLRVPKERVEPLARLVHRKAGGNPFFALHFLASLHEEGLLAFGGREGGWTWDLERIGAKGYSDNVLDLMARKLMRLPPNAQQALKALAMAGAHTEPELLAPVLDATGARVRTYLRDAERAGLIEASGNGYAFLHDRIREAAYALIPQEARARDHLRFGRLLLGGRRVEEVEADLFELVNHFTPAIALLQDAAERDLVRGLCFRAGMQARAATAFRAARDHFAKACRLLPEDRWSAPYEEVFPLLFNLAECEHLIDDPDRGAELFHELLAHARSDVDKAAVYHLRVRLYTSPPGTALGALGIGLEGLRLLGLDCPEEDEALEEAIRADEAAIAALLRDRGIPGLAGTAEIGDPRAAAALDLLADAMMPSSQSPRRMRWLTLKGMEICLGKGHAASSAIIYTYYAVLLLPVPGRIREALAFSDLAAALNALYNDHRRRPHVLAFHAGVVHSWGRPFASANILLAQTLLAAQMAWDRRVGPAIGTIAVWIAFEAGDPISEVRSGAGKYLDYAAPFGKLYTYLIRQYVQLLACLEGRTAGLLSFDDDGFKEEDALAIFRKVDYRSGIWQFWALKSIAAVYFGQHEEALRYVLAQREFPTPFFSTLQAAAAFFHALAATALYPDAPPERQIELAAMLEEHLPRLKQWAEDCPENFLHRYQLVLAEKARIEGRDLEAMRLYERAASSARESGLIQMESLACELAARFYLAIGLGKNAAAHLRDARAGYLRWGATAKVAQLDREFPDIEKPAWPGPTATLDGSADQFDLPHVLKASQAVSGEIDLDMLVETLLRIVLEQAGADRGLLLLPHGEDFRVEAEADVGPDGTRVHLPRTPLLPGQIAEAVFRYVIRSHERVLLEEAPVTGLFADDPYLRQQKPRSLLCLPLLKQSRLIGVLYLENRLAAGAFTPGRVAALEVLASQAAISLENARLYTDLDEERSRLQAVIKQVPAGLIIAEAPSGRFLVA
ncbi:MAG: AAA family ATPase, partial [Fibrobacteria bacterium]